jgi:hypothetical protein
VTFLRVLPLAFVVVAAMLGARLLTIAPGDCGDPDPDAWRESSIAAGQWMQRALRPDGSYVYIYDAEQDSSPDEYNEVRHAGVTMALYQIAGRTADQDALGGADRALDWMIAHLHRQDGWAALTRTDGSRAPLGASALMLVALAERRLATGDGEHDTLIGELGAFLESMQRPDGGFHVAFDVRRGRPDTAGTSRYYPGEALWALALLNEALPDMRWETAARDAARFISTRRDEVENVQTRPLNDHWAAYGFAEMSEWRLDEPEVAYARRLVDRFAALVEREAEVERGSAAARLSGREPRRGASLGTWVEGLAALWRLAAADERLGDLQAEIEEALWCAAGILTDRQVTASEAAAFGTPELAMGAWFSKGETRMDDQQHSLSGLLYASDASEGRVRREPDPLEAVP